VRSSFVLHLRFASSSFALRADGREALSEGRLSAM
jgi:hypothetical protein